MSIGNYEIHVLSGDSWNHHSNKDNETDALKEARKLLQRRICKEAKVLLDGTVIFNEDINSMQKKAGIGKVRSKFTLKSRDDFYSANGRKFLGQLLNDHLDKSVTSPTELLHNAKKMEELMDKTIYRSIVDHLASMQAVQLKTSEDTERDKIFGLFDEVLDRARRIGYDDIVDGKFNEFIAELENFDDQKVRFRFNVSFSLRSVRAPSWEAKFTLLRDLLGKELEIDQLHEKTIQFLDDQISEWLSMPTAILEILGQQPDRYNAMDVLVKLCTGSYENRRWDTPALEFFSKLMTKLPMSQCRQTLAARLEHMLISQSPLTKGDFHDQKHAFKQLFPQFIGKGGTILGGEHMAEALTICGTRSFSRERNLENPQEAITYILEHFGAPILQLKYLLTLGHSRFGKDCANIICDFIPTFMEGPEHVHDIVHYKLPLKRKIKTLTDLQKDALGLKLPKDMNTQLVDWLDDLLFRYLDEERIVDKMDSPELTLFERTTSMLQFCASGLLIEGKTLDWVRDRVQDHLRQPNFVEKFTEDVQTEKKKELVITQLHVMLEKAGLQG